MGTRRLPLGATSPVCSSERGELVMRSGERRTELPSEEPLGKGGDEGNLDEQAE
jgi:hypothetical protein